MMMEARHFQSAHVIAGYKRTTHIDRQVAGYAAILIFSVLGVERAEEARGKLLDGDGFLYGLVDRLRM
jgi:hypothetical protein